MSKDTFADSEGVSFTCPTCGSGISIGTDWSELLVEEECPCCGQAFEMEVFHAGVDFEITCKGQKTPFVEGHY